MPDKADDKPVQSAIEKQRAAQAAQVAQAEQLAKSKAAREEAAAVKADDKADAKADADDLAERKKAVLAAQQKATALKSDELASEEAHPPTKVLSSFPAVPAAGHSWTDAERIQALAAYGRALKNNDPDAGRMRTLISIHSPGDSAQHETGPQAGVTFKA